MKKEKVGNVLKKGGKKENVFFIIKKKELIYYSRLKGKEYLLVKNKNKTQL